MYIKRFDQIHSVILSYLPSPLLKLMGFLILFIVIFALFPFPSCHHLSDNGLLGPKGPPYHHSSLQKRGHKLHPCHYLIAHI
jgi:hypothetical protein